MKRVGLLGTALIGGGFGLNLVGPVVDEDEDDDDEVMVLGSFDLPLSVCPVLFGVPLVVDDDDDDEDDDDDVFIGSDASFSDADELRLTGEQSLEKLELSPLTGEDVIERFDGDDDRFDNGEGKCTGRNAVIFGRLFEPTLWLLADTEVDPFSELSVHAPSDETDSASGSVLIRFFWAVLNDRSVGSIDVKKMLLLFVSGKWPAICR